MEQSHENYAIMPIHDESQSKPIKIGKRKNGPMRVLKVLLFMLRGRSRKSRAIPVNNGSKTMCRNLVGSMRLLHLQSNQSPRAISQPNGHSLINGDNSDGDAVASSASDFPEEEEPSPLSSCYASAEGLNELGQSEEDDDGGEEPVTATATATATEEGDEMIDEKAEEFIAQFYKQMRLQRLDSTDRGYDERSQRSLGL